MDSMLHIDPRFTILAIPETFRETFGGTSPGVTMEAIIQTILGSTGVMQKEDYFILPLSESVLYSQALETAQKHALQFGGTCDVLDRDNALVRFTSIQEGKETIVDRHLRIIYIVGDSDASVIIH